MKTPKEFGVFRPYNLDAPLVELFSLPGGSIIPSCDILETNFIYYFEYD